ncbi:polysaccharide biosynthesis tyrosine autokinase [bacterium]|nr:polysaccharide biosynthesis tyrosine autokinase [bacterium]
MDPEASIQRISFSDFLLPIRRNRWAFLLSFSGVFLTVAYLTLTSVRIYQATATLFINEASLTRGQIFESSNPAQQKFLVKNQISILKSRNLASDVIRRLEASPDSQRLNILGNHTVPYHPWSVQRNFHRWFGGSGRDSKPSLSKKVKDFRSATKAIYEPESNIITLKGTAPVPEEAAVLVNTWIEAYQIIDQTVSRGDLGETSDFLGQKLSEIEVKLEESEERLSRFQRETQLVSLSEETNQLVAQLTNFESSYNQARTDAEAVEKQISYLKGQLDETKKNLVEDMIQLSRTGLQELQKERDKLIAEKAAYEAQILGAGYATEDDIRLRQMENRLRGVQEKIIEETKKLIESGMGQVNPLDHSQTLITRILDLEISLNALKARQSALKKIVDEYSQKLTNLPAKSLELARLERDVQVNNKLYVMLREKYEETQIREAGTSGIVQVVDRAIPPVSYIRPRTGMNLVLGLVFGLLLGLGIAFGKAYFDDTLYSAAELKAIRLEMIGIIPRKKSRRFPLSKNLNPTLKRVKSIYPFFLLRKGTDADLTEAYRTVRTTLFYHVHQKNCRSILFTSPEASEGKSTTVANMAVASALKGVRTLLIDSDLRQPVLDYLFLGTFGSEGLTQYLGKRRRWRDLIRETPVRELDLMASGPPVKNAPELLGSRLMSALIEKASQEYGILFLDAPPVLPVTDALVLASLVDAVVLVARGGQTTRTALQRSLENLKKIRANVLGIILTCAETSRHTGYRDYSSPKP